MGGRDTMKREWGGMKGRNGQVREVWEGRDNGAGRGEKGTQRTEHGGGGKGDNEDMGEWRRRHGK